MLVEHLTALGLAPVILTRVARRNALLRLLPDGTLEIRAPRALNENALLQFVEQNQNWIVKHRSRLKQRLIQKESFPRNLILYQGNPLTLTPAPDLLSSCIAEENKLWVSGHPERMGKTVERWLRLRAETEIPDRLKSLSRHHGLENRITQIRITNTRSRWGSCSARGTLSLCWKLIMAPPAVLDYVALHELAHLRHLNHSDAFWATVAAFDPNYPAREQWLKENTLLIHRSFDELTF